MANHNPAAPGGAMSLAVNRLNPGCWIAHSFNAGEFIGERMSIAFLRACLESAPTFPETWTCREGDDFARMWEGR